MSRCSRRSSTFWSVDAPDGPCRRAPGSRSRRPTAGTDLVQGRCAGPAVRGDPAPPGRRRPARPLPCTPGLRPGRGWKRGGLTGPKPVDRGGPGSETHVLNETRSSPQPPAAAHDSSNPPRRAQPQESSSKCHTSIRQERCAGGGRPAAVRRKDLRSGRCTNRASRTSSGTRSARTPCGFGQSRDPPVRYEPQRGSVGSPADGSGCVLSHPRLTPPSPAGCRAPRPVLRPWRSGAA